MKSTDEIHAGNITYLERLFSEGKITAIPDAINPTIRFFKSGGGNHLYLIESVNGRYLARINYYHLKNEWQIKTHEFDVLRLVEPLGIAPRAYFLDTSDEGISQHCIVVNFIEGEAVSQLGQADVEDLARILRKLHASIQFNKAGDRLPPADPLPYRCDIFTNFAAGEDKQIEQYGNLSGISEVITPYNQTREALGLWFRGLRIFDDIDQFCLCHEDLKIENILKTEQGMQLIDWEQAGSDIPETDIAGLFSGCRFTEQQQNRFLGIYYSDGASPVALDRIQAIKKVLDFFRIIEDYIILCRKPWDAQAMLREIGLFKAML